MLRVSVKRIQIACRLWRADHSQLEPGESPPPDERYYLTRPKDYKCISALVVFGNDVTIFGLAAEHTLGDVTVWEGERGRVYFYQCELPYDVSTELYQNHVGYHVADQVRKHEVIGIGIYCFFRDAECLVEQAIRTPTWTRIRVVNAFTQYLKGNSGILSVLNGKGPSVGTPWGSL